MNYDREVSLELLQRVLQANRWHLLLRTPGPIPFIFENVFQNYSLVPL